MIGIGCRHLEPIYQNLIENVLVLSKLIFEDLLFIYRRGGPNENGSHRLISLSDWPLVGRTIMD